MSHTKKAIALGLALTMMLAAAGLLTWLHGHQRLGTPGVKTAPLEGSKNLEVQLPEKVLDYTSEKIPIDDIVLNFLPPDTSYGSRKYTGPNGDWTLVNVVLMGADRTSIHKPQFCLEGQGWHLDPAPSSPFAIPVDRPTPYELPVIKLTGTREVIQDGQRITYRGIYVYWYVADGVLSASTTGFERMWLMGRDLLRTGVLQRWAYVSYFAVCVPGQEDATFDRMKKLIAASVPEFQLTPAPKESPTLTASRDR